MANQINERLMGLLKTEFDRIRIKTGSPTAYQSVGDMAEFLKISPSALSHYRNSSRFLGHTAARQIAQQLRSNELGGTAEDREALAEALYSARPLGDESQAEAHAWIQQIGVRGHLLLVEFRDMPAARPSSPNETLAKALARDVGQAVANGLTYALLFPFPDNFQTAKIPTPLRNYLNLVWDSVLRTYNRILDQAFEECMDIAELSVDRPSEDEFKKLLISITKRLRVYHWRPLDAAGNTDLACPGLGYKLFFHREGDSQPEVWQWISTSKGEHLVQKETTEIELSAIQSRFFPLCEWFEDQPVDSHSLPTTDEIDAYLLDDDSGQASICCKWAVFSDAASEKALERKISQTMRKYAQSQS